MKIEVMLFALLLATFGGGCRPQSEVTLDQKEVHIIPEISIRSPHHGTVTTSTRITIDGTSNMNEIFLDGSRIPVTQDHFTTQVNLHEGENRFLFLATTGVTTTTLPLVITQQ